MKRNGIRAGINEISESFSIRKLRGSDYVLPSEHDIEVFKKLAANLSIRPLISVVVPAYNTDPFGFEGMLDSVLTQAYDNLEIIIADASDDKAVLRAICDSKSDSRIKYRELSDNKGISDNTNAALDDAEGDYIALLDHDDLLTPDAFLRIIENIISFKKRCKKEPDVIYSDEDKTGWDGKSFTERNSKPDFDPELLLNNNYICHLCVMKAELLKKLRFRSEYDGAQDFDLLLRAVREGATFSHVPQILYHWRTSPGSSASNTEAKLYAYEAGVKALTDHAGALGLKADVYNLRNVGYYEFRYSGDIFEQRKDLGAVGGRIVSEPRRGKITGGIMDADGKVLYEGLPVGYTGYFHRAVCQQSAPALDIRCIKLNPELEEEFYKITGVKYSEHRTPGMVSMRPHENGRPPQEGEKIFDAQTLPEDADIKKMSLELSRRIRELGYGMLYYPSWQVRSYE